MDLITREKYEKILTHGKLNAKGCLIWGRYINPKGAPLIAINKVPKAARRILLYHVNPIPNPEQFIVASTCEQSSCINPEHLLWVSRDTLQKTITEKIQSRSVKNNLTLEQIRLVESFSKPVLLNFKQIARVAKINKRQLETLKKLKNWEWLK